MTRRNQRSKTADEQPASLAGWLYADLFLLLFVVGLSAAWITKKQDPPPESKATPTTSTSTSTTTTTLPKERRPRFVKQEVVFEPFQRSDRSAIEDELNSEIEERGLSDQTKVAVAVIYGGSSVCTPTGTEGRQSAEDLFELLKESDSRHFYEDTAVVPISRCQLGAGNFVLRLYLVDFAGSIK
jgi:hypothetical protein